MKSKGDKNGRNKVGKAGSGRGERTAAHDNRPGYGLRTFNLGDAISRPDARNYGGVFRTIRVHTLLDKGKV